MKFTGTLIALGCSLVVFSACKKSENGNNNNLSPKGQLLVAGKWQQSASTATLNYMGKDTTVDLFAMKAECDKDDFILFSANGTATIDENTNKCPNDAQIETATWALQDNDTRILLTDDNPDTYELEVTSSQATLKIVKSNSSGTPVTYVDTYKNIR